ncbi:peptide chain release factor N(5)-glutamine methyltransferase [Patescibacteria group bacterium]|nr:peptide chain release factor N(5)-glutamine methyltransferase [Patescibacteria group bacterium]
MTDEERLLREKYNEVETSEFFTDCVRLKNGEPLAYVIGWVPFLDCRIYLDSHPLIPRPETEFWVEDALAVIQQKEKAKVLDLFAGSGAIGVAVLKHAPHAHVDFGEIDPAHIPTIQKNIDTWSTYEVDHARARVIETDVWSNIKDSYDFILTNPPYIAKELRGRVQNSVLLHEPHTALFADDNGFHFIEETIAEAKAHLSPAGVLWIEHEPEQAERLRSMGTEAGFTVQNKSDQYGVLRYSVLSIVA